jgi:hypothetical protein
MVPLPRSVSRKVLSRQIGRWPDVFGRTTLVGTANQVQKDIVGSSLIVARPHVSNTLIFNECDLKGIEKDAKTELIKALQNIIDIQKSLPLKNGVWPMGGDDASNHPQSVSSWKRSVDNALSSGNIPQAIELFYSSPTGIELSRNISVYDSYKNLIFRTDTLDTGTVFDIFEASEDFYANAQEIVDGVGSVKLLNCRQQILKE